MKHFKKGSNTGKDDAMSKHSKYKVYKSAIDRLTGPLTLACWDVSKQLHMPAATARSHSCHHAFSVMMDGTLRPEPK